MVDFNVKIFWQMLEKELIEGRPLHNINETNYKSVPKSVWSDIWNPQIFFVNLSTQNFEERNYRIEKRDNKLYVVEIKYIQQYAKVAQLVEHNLAKVDVEGSNPFFRSQGPSGY